MKTLENKRICSSLTAIRQASSDFGLRSSVFGLRSSLTAVRQASPVFRLLTSILLLLSIALSSPAQTNYFRIIGGIPHLAEYASTGSVSSPEAGMVIYSTADAIPMLYNGSSWVDLCSGSTFAGNDGYLKIGGGIAALPVKAAATGSIEPGSMYLSTTANSKLQVYNGSSWNDIEATGTLATGRNYAALGKEFLCPVLATDPTGISTGAFYLNSTDETLKWYDGLAWKALECGPPYPTGSVNCISGSTKVVDVFNPTTGKTWMDRNLGASQVASSSTDADAFGDLYQWGRFSDGHQCRTSPSTGTLANTTEPLLGNSWDGWYITTSPFPYDWLLTPNDNLWQGVSGTNNPCPDGYRIPTEAEWNTEIDSWGTKDVAGAYASQLKLPKGGSRGGHDGTVGGLSFGLYWASDVDGVGSIYMSLTSTSAHTTITTRSGGLSVRCIKD